MSRCALGVAVGLAVAGCGFPGMPRVDRRASSPIAVAQAGHQYPSPPAPPEHVTSASASPAAAVAAFASAYINWTADAVAADMARLAARSIGQARAATQLAAGQTASDYELHRDGIANSGTVEAIARVRGGRNQYVVVTREQTTATGTTAYQGLEPAWHVTIATVSEVVPGRWVVSGWEPQS